MEKICFTAVSQIERCCILNVNKYPTSRNKACILLGKRIYINPMHGLCHVFPNMKKANSETVL